MEKYTILHSPAILLLIDNIDTDQIIPARFLKVTDKQGLGGNLFADWRYLEDGSVNPDFILNYPASKSAAILVTGENFGCGSSREHAAWALTAFGIRAVIAPSFSDIFRNNALKNGLLPISLTREENSRLVQSLTQHPHAELTVNLPDQTLTLSDGALLSFPIDPFSKTCLINGVDELGYLLSFEPQIAAYEAARNDSF